MRVRNNDRVPRVCEPNLLPITESARPTRPFTTVATAQLSSAPRTTSQESNGLEITIPRIGYNNYQTKISKLRPRFWFHNYHVNNSTTVIYTSQERHLNYSLYLTGTSLVIESISHTFTIQLPLRVQLFKHPFSVG